MGSARVPQRLQESSGHARGRLEDSFARVPQGVQYITYIHTRFNIQDTYFYTYISSLVLVFSQRGQGVIPISSQAAGSGCLAALRREEGLRVSGILKGQGTRPWQVAWQASRFAMEEGYVFGVLV